MCCNGIRKEKYAFPAYYLTDIQQYIDYGVNGEIIVKASIRHYDDVRACVSSAKLFIRPLKDIRRLWYELRHVNYRDIYNCQDEIARHKLISSALTNMNLEDKKKFIQKFKSEDFWNTFMLYHKFYSIMNRLYP